MVFMVVFARVAGRSFRLSKLKVIFTKGCTSGSLSVSGGTGGRATLLGLISNLSSVTLTFSEVISWALVKSGLVGFAESNSSVILTIS